MSKHVIALLILTKAFAILKLKKPPRTVRYTYILSEPNLSLRRIFRYSTFFSHALVSNVRFSRFKVRMTTNEFLSPCRTWLFYIFFVCKHFQSCSIYNVIIQIDSEIKFRVFNVPIAECC